MKARLALVLAASLGLAACGDGDGVPPTAQPMSPRQPENLLTLVSKPALSRSQGDRLASIRAQPATAEVHLARSAASPGQLLRQGAALRIAVAPGVQVVATGERVTQRAADDISWAGPLQGAEGWVQAVFMEGGVTATVRVGSVTYSVQPLGDGLHAVTRIDQNSMPPEHDPDNPRGALTAPVGFALDGLAAVSSGAPGEVGIAAVSTVNVLVAYTASAATAAGGNIASKIQLAVDETNTSYANSGISINMVRVNTSQVTYSEAGRTFSQHISALQGTTDGMMDNVHTLRNTYAADVVMLVVNDTEACGIAAAIKATATSAFTVADQSCITGYYSFAHEIGHLQGARHDRFVDGSTTPYAYGHGYIPSTKNWRTIMSYGNNCSNCTRIQWWSNPLKTYPPTGQVMGTAASEDNARVLNLTAATVAAFR
jgi:hypothetical protein